MSKGPEILVPVVRRENGRLICAAGIRLGVRYGTIRKSGSCKASAETRLSSINRDRTRIRVAIGEEFLYCVKAAGFAVGGTASGRACGLLRPVPPSAAVHST